MRSQQQRINCCQYTGMVLYCLVWPLLWVFYHMFCCCLCDTKADRRFRKPPEVGRIVNYFKRRSEDNKIMSALVMLLKRSPQAINKLSDMRVNPYLTRVLQARGPNAIKHRVKMRNDLEFYVPQLVAHYLRMDLSQNEVSAMKNFILGCCRENLFFAHRVWFNLQACSIISQLPSPQTQV